MEPDSEPLSAIPFVEDPPEPDKHPDWDRESDWSEDSSIAWSEDEDDRLCNEVLRTPDNLWPLVNESVFDGLDPLDWSLVQDYFNQNQDGYLETGFLSNLTHAFQSSHPVDRAIRQIEECLQIHQEVLWQQLSVFINRSLE